MNLFRERLGKIPSLVVDTGYFMSDERSAHGELRPDVAVKDDWVLKASSQFPVDVVNVSSHDLRYFASLFKKAEFARRSKSEAILNRLVSANTVSDSPHIVTPRPFIVREFPSRQTGSKPVRVAFIGLTETAPAPPPGFKFIDPVEAAKRAVQDARKKAELVIVLAKASSEEAARIAREVAGIDVIIAGNALGLEQAFTLPVKVGQTMIAFTPFETRMLGELRVYRNPEGRFSTKQRFITLDEIAIPEDLAAKRLVDAATREETGARTNSAKSLEAWLAASIARNRRPAPDPSKQGASLYYVTSGVCSECHVAQYVKWSNGRHAHAADSFVTRPSEFEMRCLACHATAARMKSADQPETPGFQGVHCEQCHGPGSEHVAKPTKGYGRIANMQTACTVCHTPEISPGFDTRAAWTKIKH